MSVIEEIAAERRRQMEVEGWTPEHDDAHDMGELAQAGACYAYSGSGKNPDLRKTIERRDLTSATEMDKWVPRWWPFQWPADAWKPKDKRRDLIRAAALIVAEIERLDRCTP